MLRVAVAIGAVCAARALTLHSGDELRSSDDDPLSPDHQSFIKREDASSARMLSEAIMRKDEYVEDDYPALRLAARQGFVNAVRQLLELGASANVRFDVDTFGDDATPLHVAAHFGRGKIIELLVRDGGADVDARMVDPYTSDTYDYYKTALCVALDRNHTRTARTLLRLGANFTKLCPSPEDDANDWAPLLLAAEKANVEVVADLLQRGADANASDDNGDTALILAGSFEVIELLLDAGAFIDDALHKACYDGNVGVVRKQLKRGADVNSKGLAGCRPLHYAAQGENPHEVVQIVQMLVAAGADINAPNYAGMSPLYMLISMPRPSEFLGGIRALLDAGADPDTLLDRDRVVNGYMSPLHYAVVMNERQIVKILLDAGADVNLVDEWGKTPLHEAAFGTVRVEQPDAEIPLMLIDAGADVNARTDSNNTPLHIAAYAGHNSVAQALLRHGADVHAGPVTPLALTGWSSREDDPVAWLLMKHGAKFPQINDDDPSIRRDVEGREVPPPSSFEGALEAKKAEFIKLSLLSRGTEEFSSGEKLCVTIEKSDRTLLTMLKLGTSANSMCPGGEPALNKAVRAGSLKHVQHLLRHGAYVNARDLGRSKGYTALLHAAAGNRLDIARALLDAKADIEAADFVRGNAPLYGAALHGHVKVVELLLERGAAVNTTNKGAWSPLGTAAYEGHVEVARALVRAGADPFERLGCGSNPKSPHELAEERGHKDVVAAMTGRGLHPALIPFLTLILGILGFAWGLMAESTARKGVHRRAGRGRGGPWRPRWSDIFADRMAVRIEDVDTVLKWISFSHTMFAATTILALTFLPDLGVPRPMLVAWLVVFILGALASFLRRTRYLAWADVLDPWHDRCLRVAAYATIFVLLDIFSGDKRPVFLRTMFGVVLFGCVVWWEGSAAWTAVTTWLAEKRKQQRLERKAEAARRRKQVKRDRTAAAQAERLDREAAAEAARAALDREAAEAARAALDCEAAAFWEWEARYSEAAAWAERAAASEEKTEEPMGHEESKHEPAAPEGYEIVARVLERLGEVEEVLPKLLNDGVNDAAIADLIMVEAMDPPDLMSLGMSRTTAEAIIAAISESAAVIAPPRGKVLVDDDILDAAAAHATELETSLTARQAEVARLKEILKAQHREIPDAYVCPISLEPMEDPVLAADGHSYERREIARHFDLGRRTSPMTGAPLPHTQLMPNHALKKAIQAFLEEVRQFDCEL
jgi:ankyrin repeat protein